MATQWQSPRWKNASQRADFKVCPFGTRELSRKSFHAASTFKITEREKDLIDSLGWVPFRGGREFCGEEEDVHLLKFACMWKMPG